MIKVTVRYQILQVKTRIEKYQVIRIKVLILVIIIMINIMIIDRKILV